MNFSGEDICQLACDYSRSGLLTFVHYCHITISSLALLALVSNLPLPFLWYKKLGVHLNLKIILINLSILYALHSISFIISQTINQYRYRFYKQSDPCDLLITRWKCLSYRSLNHLVKFGVTFSQLGIIFERAYAALFPTRYDAISGKIGILTIIITWLAIFFGMYYILYDESWDDLIPYCIITDWKTNQRIGQEYLFLLAIDILVTIIHIFITIYNRHKLQKRFEMLAMDNLQKAYLYRKSLRTMSVFLPLSAIHSFIFIIFMTTFTIVRRSHQDDIYNLFIVVECFNTILCIYCLLMPTIFFLMRKKLDLKKISIAPSSIHLEIYFSALERYWKYTAPDGEYEKFQRIVRVVKLIRVISRRQIEVNQMYKN